MDILLNVIDGVWKLIIIAMGIFFSIYTVVCILAAILDDMYFVNSLFIDNYTFLKISKIYGYIAGPLIFISICYFIGKHF